MLVSRVRMVRFKTEMTQFRTCRRGERGKRRGLGPRKDVLTTCKAVTLRGGQRIIAVFFPQYFSCISYLSFGTEIAGETKPQPS